MDVQVRRDSPDIDLPILKEAMDKVRLGLRHTPLPDSPAKRRYAVVEAARAVAFALTPGLPPLEHVTIRPRGGAQARILFVPQEPRGDGGSWHLLTAEGAEVNAVKVVDPLTPFQLSCGLLTPLYVARCCEEVLFGQEGVSLVTSREISKAGELARWIVVDSKLHPSTRDTPMMTNMRMGGGRDPTTAWQDTAHDADILALQRGAYDLARRLVQERRAVIERVATELCENEDETVLGSRIIQLLRDTPLGETEPQPETASSSGSEERATNGVAAAVEGTGGSAVVREVLGELLNSEDAQRLAEVVMGRISEWDLVPGSGAREKATQVKQQLLDPEARRRLDGIARFKAGEGGWPEAPKVPDDKGPGLTTWLPAEDEHPVISL